MEIKDLRISNLLYYNNEEKEISAINSDSTIRFKDKEKGCIGCFSIKTPLIKPIPLTEEWLLKFGFKRFPWGLVKDNLLFKDDLKCSYLILQVGNGFEVKVKYVHELQNLYFALTGEELAKV